MYRYAWRTVEQNQTSVMLGRVWEMSILNFWHAMCSVLESWLVLCHICRRKQAVFNTWILLFHTFEKSKLSLVIKNHCGFWWRRDLTIIHMELKRGWERVFTDVQVSVCQFFYRLFFHALRNILLGNWVVVMKKKYKNKLQPFLPLILLSSLTFPLQKWGSRAGFQRDPAIWLPESRPMTR